MKTLFVSEKIKYDGEQLKPLTNYLRHGLLGNSLVSWIGPCDVTVEHMIDGEDLRAREKIAADEMVHFVFEIFDVDLKAAVVWQRLMAEMVKEYILKNGKNMQGAWKRKGDDLYLDNKKLNISIATKSAQSCVIHLAVNNLPTGAPVAIVSLQELGIEDKKFAQDMMFLFQNEIVDVIDSSYKVRTF